jgi:hypothetical protein
MRIFRLRSYAGYSDGSDLNSGHEVAITSFRKQGIEERINLQRDNNKAKVYQVRQVRAVILKYRLRGTE